MFDSALLTDRELFLLRHAKPGIEDFLTRDRKEETLELLTTICDLRRGSDDTAHLLEMELRRIMWLTHGHIRVDSDGDMQCEECARLGCRDYKRSSMKKVREVYTLTTFERAAKARLEKDASEDPSKPVSPPRG